MALIDWNTRLLTGQATMDRDHQKITGLINDMAESVLRNKDKRLCDAILRDIVHRTEAHFAMEAKLMDHHHYPRAEEHKAHHELLMHDLLTFKSWYDAGSTPQFGSVLAFLEGWWTHHIVWSDKELAEFISPHAAPDRAAVQPHA